MPKKNTGDMTYPERFIQLQQRFTEKRAFANRLSCRSDKIRNRAIFGRLRGSFTAPKLKSVTMLLRFCFTSVISLNDLNDLRIIEARGLKYRQNIGWPGTRDSHTGDCLNLRSIFHVEFATEKTLSGQFAKENL